AGGPMWGVEQGALKVWAPDASVLGLVVNEIDMDGSTFSGIQFEGPQNVIDATFCGPSNWIPENVDPSMSISLTTNPRTDASGAHTLSAPCSTPHIGPPARINVLRWTLVTPANAFDSKSCATMMPGYVTTS